MKKREPDTINPSQFKDKKQGKEFQLYLILNIKKEIQKKMIQKMTMIELKNQLNQRKCNI